MNDIYEADRVLFPDTAYININHLGLAQKPRFNAKQKLIRTLAARNVFVGVEELHYSSARAQDCFFDHVASHAVLYNTCASKPGQCLMICRRFLEALGIENDDYDASDGDSDSDVAMDKLSQHHVILIPGVAHAFWWQHDQALKMVVNVYLDAHDSKTRIEQLVELNARMREFLGQNVAHHSVVVVGGDRNFVVKQDQHETSAGTSWWPGEGTMNAWGDLLQSLQVSRDTELEDFTWERKTMRRDGPVEWVHRTIDFAFAAYDPVRYTEWQCHTHAVGDYGSGRASDHKAVEVRFQKRHRRTQSRSRDVRVSDCRALPQWLFEDPLFLESWTEALKAWESNRSNGLAALREFAELTRAHGREWMLHHVVEARSDDHRFDICMVVQSHARSGNHVSFRQISKWLGIYPALNGLLELEIDMLTSSVRIITSDAFIAHIHELAARVVQQRAQEQKQEQENEGDTSAGVSFKAAHAYPGAASDLRKLLPFNRFELVQMWNEAHTECMQEPQAIGTMIRQAGLRRSGNERGDPSKGNSLLEHCTLDLSQCRTMPTLAEVMRIMLSIKRGKRPGSTGICGLAYKMNAVSLAPVFLEAFAELQGSDLDLQLIPTHLHTSLWIPIAKRQGADTIDAVRDLELPNEDAKVLERMHLALISECASPQILPLNQAFVEGGDIMYNVSGLHEEFQSGTQDRFLRLMLLMDCTKGFNYASHSWTHRVFEKAQLPLVLQRSIARLVETQFAILLFAGIAFEIVQWLSGYRQGGPLSTLLFVLVVAPFLQALRDTDGVRVVFGFCDDWEVSIKGLRPIRRIRALMEEFEAASGQRIHRTKSTWLPCRQLTSVERRMLSDIWPDARVVANQTVLGTPLGHQVRAEDFTRKPLSEFMTRLNIFQKAKLSCAMRLLVVNCFLYPLFSYVGRVMLFPADLIRIIVARVARFVTPIPFCRLEVFTHLRGLLRVRAELRDFQLDNIAAILATAWRLHESGALQASTYAAWLNMRQPNQIDGAHPGFLTTIRPLNHISVAYNLFRQITGNTMDYYCQRWRRGGNKIANLHARLYKQLLSSERCQVDSYVCSRVRARGLDADAALANLRRLPSCIPDAQRLLLFRNLLNGLHTSRRLRFRHTDHVEPCVFCAEAQGDTQYHWVVCPTLRAAAVAIYGVDVGSSLVHVNSLMLQVPMQGTQLQRVAAFWFAIWRSRGVLMRNLTYASAEDFLIHLRTLIDDPWLTGNPYIQSKSERRRTRLNTPAALHEHVVYNSDGASRGNGDEARQASCGAVLQHRGIILAALGVYLGDTTNNVAEYDGVLRALRHAQHIEWPAIRFRVDSMLIAKQLQGKWSCRAPHLIPIYEECLGLLQRLRARTHSGEVSVEHVYREYNGDADGLANEAIDAYDATALDGIVVDDCWYTFDEAVLST